MNRILVCARFARERDYWMRLAVDDGLQLDRAKQRGIFPKLDLELRFEIFDGPHDAEKVRGLNLDGVLNFGAVQDEECRAHILARIRP